ncbi:MAG TPA: DinB family protein [Methylomirabilota bacterium]|nr:DinB family protein [Methylomirabilota bacterium]
MSTAQDMNAEFARIRSYLQAQGAKLAPEQIIGKVQEAMGQLGAAAAAVPAARFTQPPAPGEWSANEVMAHVVEAGRFFGDAIVRVLDGQAPGQPRDAAARDTSPRPLSEWWAMFERDRTALFTRVRSAHPMSRLEATIPHPFFGALNWRETLLFLRLHDLDHAGQLQKVAAAF